MSTIELDSQPVALDSILKVSVNYSFDPLKQALVYIMKQLKENNASVSELRDRMDLEKYGYAKNF